MSDFERTVGEVVSGAFCGFGLSVGFKLGLWEHIHQSATQDNPITSDALADALKLRERYVREWLRQMAAYHLLQVDQTGTKFWLPSGAYEQLNSGYAGLFLALNDDLTSITPRLTECFKPDGPTGLPYSLYPSFHAAMERFSGDFFGSELAGVLPALIGQDTVDRLKQGGLRCLDVCCATGNASIALAHAFPNNKFYGIDFNAAAIEKGQKATVDQDNVDFRVGDASKLKEEQQEWLGTMEVVTVFDAVHDTARPDKVLKGLAAMVRPGGVLLVSDVMGTSNVAEDRVQMPDMKVAYACSLLHCLPVAMNEPDSLGVGTMWGRRVALEMMAEAGMKDVNVKTLPEDKFNYFYVWHKPTERRGMHA